MTWKQVGDVVDQIRNAHRRIHEALEQPRGDTVDPRTRALLDSLQREGEELDRILEQAGNQGKQRLMDTWLQYVPDEELQNRLNDFHVTSDLSADEIVARKLEIDEALISLLQQLEQNCSVPRLREFFDMLLQFVQSRTQQQAWRVREYQGDADPPRPQE